MLFVTEAQLERARIDRGYPRRRIYAKLSEACDQHLGKSPEDLRAIGPGVNLFAWNAFIGDLGLMYALTDDERYLDHLLRFVRSLAGDGWRTVEMAEHLHAPFLLTALAGFSDLQGSRLTDEDAAGLRATMDAIAEFLWADLHSGIWGSRERTVWNHNAIAYSAVGVAGLVLDGHEREQEWLETATDRVRHFLEVGVSPAGMTWEGHHYCGYVFKLLGLFLQGLRTRGREAAIAAAGSEHVAKLHRVPVWYAHSVFPRGGWLQNYNDSHWNPHSALLGFLLSFAHYEPELCAAVWDRLVGDPGRGSFGANHRFSSLADAMLYFPSVPIKPLQEFEQLGDRFYCPDVGYLAARDGWADDASVFTFNCGQLIGKVHDQADNNSFTFIARGDPLVIDSGAANDREVGSPSSALGHNGVFIDGVGEGIAGDGAGISGTILRVDFGDDWVSVIGDATASYNAEGYNPVRHAVRQALFVKAPIPYVITYDDVDKDGLEHAFELLVHVPSADDREAPGGSVVIATRDREPVGVASVLHPVDVNVSTEPYETQRMPLGPYNHHEVVRFKARAVNPQFVHLLAPATSDVIGRAEVQHDDTGIAVRLQWPLGLDEITFSRWRDGEGIDPPRLIRGPLPV